MNSEKEILRNLIGCLEDWELKKTSLKIIDGLVILKDKEKNKAILKDSIIS